MFVELLSTLRTHLSTKVLREKCFRIFLDRCFLTSGIRIKTVAWACDFLAMNVSFNFYRRTGIGYVKAWTTTYQNSMFLPIFCGLLKIPRWLFLNIQKSKREKKKKKTETKLNPQVLKAILKISKRIITILNSVITLIFEHSPSYSSSLSLLGILFVTVSIFFSACLSFFQNVTGVLCRSFKPYLFPQERSCFWDPTFSPLQFLFFGCSVKIEIVISFLPQISDSLLGRQSILNRSLVNPTEHEFTSLAISLIQNSVYD